MYSPNMTERHMEIPWDAEYFEGDDSGIAIFIHDDLLEVSFNNSESWETVDEFDECTHGADIDQFQKGRGFLMSQWGGRYVTENQGESWNELPIKKIPMESLNCYFTVDTHSIRRRFLWVLTFEKRYDEEHREQGFLRQVVYTSDDVGKNFRMMASPVNYHETAGTYEHYDFHFVVSSKESTLENTGIYYTRRRRCAQKPTKIQGPLRRTRKDYITKELFYTPDFGRTTVAFIELGIFVNRILIFPSNIFVITGRMLRPKLWIYNHGSFEPVRLPGKGFTLERAQESSENDEKRLLLQVRDRPELNGHKLSFLLDVSSLEFFPIS